MAGGASDIEYELLRLDNDLLRDDDELVSMTVIPKELMDRVQSGDEVEDRLVAVTEHGYGKRTEIGEFSVQGRGGLGVITIKTSDRNGKVVGARLVHDDDELMLITNLGQIIRMRVDGISIIGRNTQGVRLMTMDDEELVVSTARLIPEDEDEEFEGEEGLEGEEASDSEDASGEVAGEEE